MPSTYPLNLVKMNNTSLHRIAATAGTIFSQDLQIQFCHYQFNIQNFIWINHYSFRQVAGSAVRPLTNIPHCCTNTYQVFFRPNVIDQLFSFDYGIYANLFNKLLLFRNNTHLKAKLFFFQYKAFIYLTLRQLYYYLLTCTPL